MTAMSAARVPVRREGAFSTPPVKGATTILQGALVVMETGLAVPGKTATGLTALGVSIETVANSGADGAKRATVESGAFKFFNHGADAVVAGDIGQDCYVVDDQTVAKTHGTNTRSKAGRVLDVDSDGVWVRVGQ